jgi:hypothetical protein
MDVIQKKATPTRVSKKWLARSLSVALVGALVLPVAVESTSAFAASKSSVKSTTKVAKVGKVARGAGVKKSVTRKTPVKKAPVKKAPVKKAPVKKAPVKKAPVKKAPVKKAPVKKAPVKKVAFKRVGAKKASTKKNGKKVGTKKVGTKKVGTKKVGKKIGKKSAVTKPASSKLKKVATLGAQGAAVAAGTVAGVAVSKNLSKKKPASSAKNDTQTAPVGAGTTNSSQAGATTSVAKVIKPAKVIKSSSVKPLKKLRMRRLHVMP